MKDGIPTIDASKYPATLAKATEAVSNLIEREKPQGDSLPKNEREMLAMIVGTALRTSLIYFRTAYFLIREGIRDQPGWLEESSLTLELQTRTMLEILFNVIFLLEKPSERVWQFEKHGWKENAESLRRIETDYLKLGGKYASWARDYRTLVDVGERYCRITPEESNNLRLIRDWPTPGNIWKYGISRAETIPSAELPPARRMLKWLYFHDYTMLSGVSHANAYGQMQTGFLVMQHMIPKELRRELPEKQELRRGKAFGQLSLFLLCVTCEVHHSIAPEDLNLAARLVSVWDELMKADFARELYEMRYQDWYPFATPLRTTPLA